MAHGYESGRLDLPFVGLCTFGKCQPCLDWDKIDADVAILGIPYDMGTQYRAGARFGPRAIREASTLFSFGHGGAYDHEDDTIYLPRDKVRIVDIGDADIVHTDTAQSHAITPSTSPASAPFATRRRSISSISTPISSSSTSATASARAMAIRCAARPRRPMSPA